MRRLRDPIAAAACPRPSTPSRPSGPGPPYRCPAIPAPSSDQPAREIDMVDVTPFRVDVAPEVLADLQDRLRRTRWPEAETVDDWSQGVPLSYLQNLCAYWADGYDWSSRQARLNKFLQYRTEIDGLGVHFI